MKEHVVNSTQNTDIFSAAFMIPNVGAPFMIGLAVGFFAKKMLKLALFIGGGAIVLLFVSEYYGFYTVSDASLQGAATLATEAAQQSGSFLVNRLSRITTKGVSSVAGFYCGLKMG
jgi:uncharacterized membrane protein (Fun14 family)